MKLRPYQQQCVDALRNELRSSNRALAVVPTGGGKTAILSTICSEAVKKGSRVIILSHVKELIEQISTTLHRILDREDAERIGVCCGSLKQWNTDKDIVAGTIQTVVKRKHEFGHRNLVIIDEVHLTPMDDESMYQQTLAALESVNGYPPKIIGLTATPWRLDVGQICGPNGLFQRTAYECSVLDLIEDGYLSPLRGKLLDAPDTSGVATNSNGEYVQRGLQAVFDVDEVTRAAVDDLLHHAQGRKAGVIFCSGVQHAQHVAELLAERGESADVVTGETATGIRDDAVSRFKHGDLRWLVNVGCFTTGFDAPHVDVVALFTSTNSPGLMAQMVGRGLRKALGKTDCMILDYGGNIAKHGPVNAINPPDPTPKREKKEGTQLCMKACSACQEAMPIAMEICPYCGHENPVDRSIVHEEQASDLAPIETAEHNVKQIAFIDWRVHVKRGTEHDETAPRTLRVMVTFMDKEWCSQFYCPEHSGARWKMENWWEKVTGHPRDTMPATSVECLDMLDEMKKRGLLNLPTHARIKEEQGQYPEITHFYWRNNDEG